MAVNEEEEEEEEEEDEDRGSFMWTEEEDSSSLSEVVTAKVGNTDGRLVSESLVHALLFPLWLVPAAPAAPVAPTGL